MCWQSAKVGHLRKGEIRRKWRRSGTPVAVGCSVCVGLRFELSPPNQSIETMRYKNLDFRGNLGHSIEKRLDDRRYIEANNQTMLGDCNMFTFEPHICRTNDTWGFKMENIYYFENDKATPLGSPQLLEAVS